MHIQSFIHTPLLDWAKQSKRKMHKILHRQQHNLAPIAGGNVDNNKVEVSLATMLLGREIIILDIFLGF